MKPVFSLIAGACIVTTGFTFATTANANAKPSNQGPANPPVSTDGLHLNGSSLDGQVTFSKGSHFQGTSLDGQRSTVSPVTTQLKIISVNGSSLEGQQSTPQKARSADSDSLS